MEEQKPIRWTNSAVRPYSPPRHHSPEPQDPNACRFGLVRPGGCIMKLENGACDYTITEQPNCPGYERQPLIRHFAIDPQLQGLEPVLS